MLHIYISNQPPERTPRCMYYDHVIFFPGTGLAQVMIVKLNPFPTPPPELAAPIANTFPARLQTNGYLYYQCLSSLQWLSNSTWLPVVDLYQQSTGTGTFSKYCVFLMQGIPGAKTIKKNTNSTQNKSQTHRAK